jgi:hypothetical protein
MVDLQREAGLEQTKSSELVVNSGASVEKNFMVRIATAKHLAIALPPRNS